MPNNANPISTGIKKYHLLGLMLFIACEASLIGPFLGAFIRSYGISLAWVSIILASKNVSRMLSDIPTAIIAQQFGVKFSFLMSRLARFASIALLIYSQNKISFLFAMALYGFSMASIYGKMDAYLVQITSHTKYSGRIALSAYSIFARIVIITCGTIASYLFPKVGYSSLGQYTIAMAIGSIALLPIMPAAPAAEATTHQINPQQKLYGLKSAVMSILQKPNALSLAIALGVINIILWRSNIILSVAMLNQGASPQAISIITTMHFAITTIGYAIVLAMPKITDRTVNNLYIASIAAIALIVPTLGKASLATLMATSAILPVAQIVYERKLFLIFGDNSNNGIIISIVNSASSAFAVLLDLLHGSLVQNLSGQKVMALTITPIAIAALATGLRNRTKATAGQAK